MPKFPRSNAYTGKQSNPSWTGQTRAANSVEVAAGLSDQLYISPKTLDTVLPSFPLSVPNGGTGRATLTNHGLLIGAGTSAITQLAPGSTAGVPLISAGAAADPAYGTALVVGGGTGRASATAYAVLCGGTSSTSAQQSIAGVGTSGQVLTSNGAGALPTFQAAGGGGSVSSATVTMTSAQFKAINVTAFQLVAAQGANTIINPISIVAELVYGGSNAFTGSGEIKAIYGTVIGANSLSNSKDSSFFGATASTVTSFYPANLEAGTFAVGSIANQPICLQSDDVIAGNAAADNTVKITTFYTTFTSA